MHLVPLPVVIPLLAAALLAAGGNFLPRRALDISAIVVSAAVLAICCFLVHASSAHGTLVYWFGHWTPNPAAGHFPVGICFMVDPIGAGLAATVALLVLAAFTFSWSYFEQVKSLYHALMLAFLASMCGLCLTGDLFNLFVWFELMTATAVGLCGYKSEESQSLLGALNFAVINTVGAFLSLGGIALLYAMTGSLNMCEVGHSLASHNPGFPFLAVTFLLVSTGFLVKMAGVPFQFWLADAHAVAPTPVCILFSGVMVQLGLYAVARLYWVMFSPVLAVHAPSIRTVLLLMGCLTAVFGSIYCFGQRHFKRLLAFSTISHIGLMLIGVALLKSESLAGTAIYLLGHAMIKGCLFICAGILLHRFQSVDEFDLRGRGKDTPLVGVMLVLAALGLAGMPPFATFFGQSAIDETSKSLHLDWLSIVAMWTEILTGAAVLRVTGRVFFGWGPVGEGTSRGAPHILMDSETRGEHSETPVWMWGPAAVLLVGSALVAIWPALRWAVQADAQQFQNAAGYAAAVLDGRVNPVPPAHALASVAPTIDQLIVLLGLVIVTGLSLFPQVLGDTLNRWLGRLLARGMHPLRVLQSGRVGDYVAWLALGVAVYGGLLLLG